MKREKNSKKTKRVTLTSLILLAVTFIIVLSSWTTPLNQGAGADESTGIMQSEASSKGDTVYVEVDEKPVFPEGDMALLKFIAGNSKYPDDAKKKGITGRVVVKFIVEKDCSISDVTILHSVDSQLDAEAIRVVKSMPKFEKPGKINGRPVAVWYMVPIIFALK